MFHEISGRNLNLALDIIANLDYDLINIYIFFFLKKKKKELNIIFWIR